MALLSNWFVKIAVGLALVAIVGYDTIAIVSAHVGGKDDAGNAAYAAAQSWHDTHSTAQVLTAAVAAIPASDHLVDCHATTPDGATWVCTVRRTAPTVVAGHLSFLDSQTTATETSSGAYAP